MAETSKNKIYYNDNEDSIADVLEDMKKLAESTDNAIEKAKYNDTELKNKNAAQDEEIEQLKAKNTTQDELIEQLQAENTKLKKEINSMKIPGEATGNPIHLTDSSNLECEIVVKSNAEQETREGYNLFNPNAEFPITTNGLTITKNKDGSITYNGTAIANANINLSTGYSQDEQNEMSGKTIAMKIVSTGIGKLDNFGLKYNSSTNRFVILGITNSNTYEKVDTYTKADTDTGILYWTSWILAGTVFDNFTIYPCAVEGTEVKPYEPYGASPSPDYPSPIDTVGQNGSVEIEVCNKNLLNLESLVTKTLNGITLTKNDDGSYMLNGTATASTRINIPINLSLKKGQAYTHSIHNSYKKGLYISLNNINITMIGNNYNNFKTFTLNEDKTYTNYLIWIDSGTTFNNYIVYPMIENGSSVTDYIPHESQTAIMPIQQEMLEGDYITDVEHHGIGKYVFTGEEAVTIAGSRFQVTYYKIAKGKTAQPSLCNISTYASWAETGKHFNVNNSDCYFTIDNFDFSTVEEMKAYLKAQYEAGTPVKIYYPLVTPIDLPLTVEQQAVREQKLYTYKNITNISVDGIATLKVNYKKDLETLFNNINSALLS